MSCIQSSSFSPASAVVCVCPRKLFVFFSFFLLILYTFVAITLVRFIGILHRVFSFTVLLRFRYSSFSKSLSLSFSLKTHCISFSTLFLPHYLLLVSVRSFLFLFSLIFFDFFQFKFDYSSTNRMFRLPLPCVQNGPSISTYSYLLFRFSAHFFALFFFAAAIFLCPNLCQQSRH